MDLGKTKAAEVWDELSSGQRNIFNWAKLHVTGIGGAFIYPNEVMASGVFDDLMDE